MRLGAVLGLLPVIAGAATVALRAEAQEVRVLTVQERAPLETVILTPAHRLPEEMSQASAAEVLGRLFREHTDLDVDPQDAAAIDDRCPKGGLACLADMGGSQLLLVVSLIAEDDTHARLTALLLDAAAARNRPKGDRQDPDDLIRRTAVLWRMQPVLATAKELPSILSAMMERELRPVLEARGHWDPFGTIELSTNAKDAVVSIDERTVGRVSGPRVRIEGLRAGSRSVGLTAGNEDSSSARVDVRARGSAELTLNVIDDSMRVSRTLRDGMFYGGGGLAIAGVALTVAGFATSPSSYSVCSGPDDPCGNARFARAGGVPIAPLGYSLAGLGAAWLAGALLGDRDRMPWMELGIGVAVFTASFALSLALEQRDPLECGATGSCAR